MLHLAPVSVLLPGRGLGLLNISLPWEGSIPERNSWDIFGTGRSREHLTVQIRPALDRVQLPELDHVW